MQREGATSDLIGPYRVVRQLSVTGAVQVLLAQEDGPAGFLRHVVLKVVPDVTGAGTKDIQELVQDVTACAKLTHPAIVRTRHVLHHEGALVLVVERIESISLASLLATEPTEPRPNERAVSDDVACHIALSVCDALAHAHAITDSAEVACPLVHRAVSPSNIRLARDGSVKLDGFGFAQIMGGVAIDPKGSSAWTPAYMAPEQVGPQAPTSKVDVYAAGLILWELLTGRQGTKLPENPLAIGAILRAVATRQPEPLAKLRPDLPGELVAAVDAALVSAPDRRTISCAEMARAIRNVIRGDAGKRELRETVIRALSTEGAMSFAAIPRVLPVASVPAPSPPDAPSDAARVPRLEVPRLPSVNEFDGPDSERGPTGAPLASPVGPVPAPGRRFASVAAGIGFTLIFLSVVAVLAWLERATISR